MLGYKLLTKYVLGILLVASVSAYAVDARGASNTSIENVQTGAQAALLSDWEQVNSNGFGDLHEQEVSALENFNGYLYAGTFNVVDPLVLFDGARIFRSPNGTTWTPVTQPGFQNPHDSAPFAITDFVVFGNRLYASTGWGGNSAQIWRSSNGTSWAPMVTAGFGDQDIHNIPSLAVYNGVIYAGAGSQVSGAKIYRSTTGDSNTWTSVAPAAGTMPGAAVTGFAVFNGALYATVESEAPVQIWHSTNGTSWTSIMNNGFGNSQTIQTGGMAVFGGYLYVGAGNTTVGAQLWRTNNGTSWVQAITPAFGDANNKKVESVFVFQNQLYVNVKNAVTGIEVWRSADGALWEQVNLDGFGDSHNTGSNRGAATAEFLSQLYVGTSNVLDGGELWRKLNPNNPPTDISLSANSVTENQPVNTVVGALSAVDPDAGATFTFSLTCAVSGTNDGSFNILGTDLRTSAVFDFETKSVYNICLRVTDQGGLTFDKNFVVTVNNLNEAPTGISLSANSVDENQPINTLVGALSAVDPDAGVTVTFSLMCAIPGTNDLLFNISGTNLQTSVTFDYETKSAYDICVRVTDQDGLTFDKNFVVTVNNVNETPTSISLSTTMVVENQPVNTVVGGLTATDPDAGATFTFRLGCAVVGADDGSFNILGADLRTSATFDYETKSTYNICVSVTDQGGAAFDQNFSVTVTNVNEPPINILLANDMVAENQPINTVVGALTATDFDAGATFTFSLSCAVAGADDGSFNILGTDLRTSAVFDFETKADYNICVRVTDQGGLTFDENFIVTVNNLFESTAPTDISLFNSKVDENQPVNTVVGALTATDPDTGATFMFSLACTAAGADDGSFNILGTNLRTSAIFDFETKSNYNICVRVTDQGGLAFDKNFIITVNNLNEAPTGISLSATVVDENQPINTLVGALSATDPDAGATFTFSLACTAAGADDGSFNISGTDLRSSAIFDFETKSAYNICVRVTDQGGLSYDKNFVANVNNRNEAPTGVSLSTTVVDENQPVNMLVGALSAADPDFGSAFTFSLACAVVGADDGSFNILGPNLQTSAVFDYETKSTYKICVRATDQGGLFFDQNFVITVNDVIEISNTPGKVTGGGNLDLSNKKATFGFVIRYDAGDADPAGNLTFMDHSEKLSLKAASFTLLYIDGNHARITGFATVNGVSNVSFILDVYDYGEPGMADVFMLQIPDLNGYSTGGVITGGNIKVTAP